MKKTWRMVLLSLAVVLLTAAGILVFMHSNSMGFSTGQYLLADNGSPMIILDGSPVRMGGGSEQFAKLNSGDEILVLHNGIHETYPGSTRVYFCWRMARGSLEDLDPAVLEQLRDLGWMKQETPPTDPATEPEENTQRVSYAYGYTNLSIDLPQGWAYEVLESGVEEYGYGIHFWPEGVSEGKIRLEFYPHSYGVCGTGLETETRFLKNGYAVTLGTYDAQPYWTYMTFDEQPGNYVASTEAVADWWPEYEEQVMEILGSAELGRGYPTRQEAVDAAQTHVPGNADFLGASFDACTGQWLVTYFVDGADHVVYVEPDGTVSRATMFDEPVDEKPVIYLYPEVETEVTVCLELQGQMTSSYPRYNDGWQVTAYPDGTLVDGSGREYYCLFWEGVSGARYDFSTGTVVSGEETAAFLEDALEKLGLTPREANEFLIYWLPRMESNAYNLISFQTEAYTDAARLTIDPAPDSLLRVFMAFKALDEPVAVEPQVLEAAQRTGFTAVEWGGVQVP